LTLQKIKIIKSLIFMSVGISCIGIIFGFTFNSCLVQHIQILNDVKKYEQSLDPEFCENLVKKINLFNDDCEPQVDILDCG